MWNNSCITLSLRGIKIWVRKALKYGILCRQAGFRNKIKQKWG